MVTAFFAVAFSLLSFYAAFLLRVRKGLQTYGRVRPGPTRAEPREPALSVTVVVPMRNEAAHAAACVRSLSRQDYPPSLLECMIVDDGSEDGTAEIVSTAVSGDPRFRLLPLQGGAAGKKAAIEAAIACSRGDLILTTDADCTHHPGWVAAMAAEAGQGVDVVAGPVVYDLSRTVFERMQVLEFLGLVGVGAGLFGIGRPRLCNGANLAYRRSAFMRAGGFSGHRDIASGDDEFLVQSIVYRHGGRAVFATADEAVVRCPPSPNLGGFLAQRARWASKGLRYADGRFRAFLVVLFAFFCAGALMPIAAVQTPSALAGAVAFFVAKAALDAVILVLSARLFKVRFRWTDWAVAELCHPFYLVIVSLLGTLRPYQWKGRTHR